MKLDKLARQLRRDISASPKKAAALALMVAVALYFWAPMVWGWIAPGAGGGRTVADAGDVILEDEAEDPAAQAKKQRHVFHWEKIRRKALADPRMTPASYETTWLDPFRDQEKTSDPAQSQAAGGTAQATAGASDPAALGMTLTSVAIGAKRRSATISGESYREGDLVRFGGKEGQPSSGIEFQLVRVGFHEVELARDGKIYRLELTRATLAPGDELAGRPRD